MRVHEIWENNVAMDVRYKVFEVVEYGEQVQN
jgi:hypothetical protein